MWMKKVVMLWAASLAFTSIHAAGAPMALRVELEAVATGQAPLERDLHLTLRTQAGEPLRSARVQVTVDMPSMPMMHRLPTVTATPGREPGVYIARVKLEMPGEWAARIDVTQPARLSAVRRFTVR